MSNGIKEGKLNSANEGDGRLPKLDLKSTERGDRGEQATVLSVTLHVEMRRRELGTGEL